MNARASIALAAGSLFALAVWACGTFGDADDPPPDDGGTSSDGPGTSDATGDGGDLADASDASDASTIVPGTISPPCPRPPGPQCALLSCLQRAIYTPPTPELPFGITTDSAFVYWATLTDDPATNDNAYNGVGRGRILRTSRAVGSTATELAKDQFDAQSVALAGDYVYWGALTTATGGVAELRRTRRDCAGSCVVETVAEFGIARIHYIGAIDATKLWVLQNGSILTLVEVDAAGVGAKRTSTSLGAGDPYLAQTETHGIVTSTNTGRVDWIDHTSLAKTTLVTVADAGTNDAGEAFARGLGPTAADCKNVYGARNFGSIWRLPLDGGQPALVTTIPGAVYGMTTDTTHAYVAFANMGGVVAMDLATGASVPLWDGNVHRVAADDVGVYWGDHARKTGGAIWMMAK